MVTDSRIEASAGARGHAASFSAALDALESRLDTLEPEAGPDVAAKGLRDAVHSFQAAIKEAAAS